MTVLATALHEALANMRSERTIAIGPWLDSGHWQRAKWKIGWSRTVLVMNGD
jgi:hypothetical protein